MSSRSRSGGSPHDMGLLAWITPVSDEQYNAAIVGAAAVATRTPATRTCPSRIEAETWVKQEAEVLGLSVTWLNQAPAPQRH